MWIYRLLFACNFVPLRISPARIKLAASNFGMVVHRCLGHRISHFGNFALQKPKIKQIGECAVHTHPNVNISIDKRQHKIHARDVPFMEYHAARGRRIGMCGYTAIPEDRCTCHLLAWRHRDATIGLISPHGCDAEGLIFNSCGLFFLSVFDAQSLRSLNGSQPNLETHSVMTAIYCF